MCFSYCIRQIPEDNYALIRFSVSHASCNSLPRKSTQEARIARA